MRIAALLLLFGITYLLILRPVKKQLIRSLNADPAEKPSAIGIQTGGRCSRRCRSATNFSDRVPGAARMSVRRWRGLKNDIATRVKHEPVSASRFVQNWIREGDR